MNASVVIGMRIGADGGLLPVQAAIVAGDALAYHRAVVDALRDAPMAPLRCGTSLDNPEDHSDALSRAVDLSVDHVEIGVTLTAFPSGGQEATDGRGFLRRAAARNASADHFAARAKVVECALAEASGVTEIRRLSAKDTKVVLAVCARRNVAAAIAMLAEGMADLALGVDTSGPWPLYSFALGPTGGVK